MMLFAGIAGVTISTKTKLIPDMIHVRFEPSHLI